MDTTAFRQALSRLQARAGHGPLGEAPHRSRLVAVFAAAFALSSAAVAFVFARPAPRREALIADRNPSPAPVASAPAAPAASTPPPAPGGPPERVSRYGALSQSNFRRLFLGTIFSQFGMWMLFVGQGWLVFRVLGGSPFQLGLVSAIQGLVSVPVSLVGGGLADRFDRKRLTVAATLTAATSSFAVSYLVLAGSIHIWHLYLTAMLQGLATGIEQPSRQVLIYDTAGQRYVGNAVAVMSMGQNIARITGPTLGGALIGFYGVSVLYIVQSVCFLLAAATTLTLRVPKHARSHGEGFLASLRGGLAYVGRDRVVMALLLVALFMPFLVYPYVQFYAVFVTDVLGLGSSAYGLLASAVGFGSIPGTLYVAWSSSRKGRGRVLLIVTLVYGCLVVLFSFQRHFWPAFTVLVLAGVFNAIYGAVCNSLIQQTVDDRFRGRVMSLYTMTFATIPLGGLLMGIAVSVYGTPLAFGSFAAVATVLCAIVFLTNPRIRRL